METQEYLTQIPLFEELRGEKVVVRPYKESDAQALQEAVAESREHIRPWLPFADAHQTVEESLDWIIKQKAQWLVRENMNLGVWVIGGESRYVGGTGIHPHNWKIRSFEIGYWLRKSAEGKGYITESARLVTDFALNELKANRVMIRCDSRNTRSAAVARRLGYVFEGSLRNDTVDPSGEIRTTLVFSRIPGDPPFTG